jgi:hypothetical protein
MFNKLISKSSALSIDGSAGLGYLSMRAQTSAPSTVSGFSVCYIDSSNRLSILDTAGKLNAFSFGGSNIYTFPNITDTIATLTSTQTFSGKTISGTANTVTLDATSTISGTFANARISSASVIQWQGNITGVGALASGTIVAGFGTITTLGTASFGNITFVGATGTNVITSPDSLAKSLVLSSGGLDYVRTVTSGTKRVEIPQKLTLYDYCEFTDIAEPSNSLAGAGRIFKKSGSSGLWWKPDAAGASQNLITGLDLQSVSFSTISSTTSATYVDLPSMTLTTSNDSTRPYLITAEVVIASGNAAANSVLIIINIDGTDVTNSEREQTIIKGQISICPISYLATVATGKVIKLRYRASIAGKQINANSGTLSICGIRP